MDRDSQQQDQHTTLPQPIMDDVVPNTPAPQTPSPLQNTLSATPASAPSQQSPAAPAAAQDTDAIEPVWVDRVNQLMQQTVNDPHLLVQEFQKLKGQYIAGRYGKELKQQDGKG